MIVSVACIYVVTLHITSTLTNLHVLSAEKQMQRSVSLDVEDPGADSQLQGEEDDRCSQTSRLALISLKVD